jgi:hypothetical protein
MWVRPIIPIGDIARISPNNYPLPVNRRRRGAGDIGRAGSIIGPGRRIGDLAQDNSGSDSDSNAGPEIIVRPGRGDASQGSYHKEGQSEYDNFFHGFSPLCLFRLFLLIFLTMVAEKG